jgi:2-octaprenyl-6-methoxyphenol hydroxylase
MTRKAAATSPAQTDIAIIGAGAVGLAAALALSAQGHEVTVIGDSATPADGRTVALLGASWRLLARFGVTEALKDDAAPLCVMRLIDDSGSLFRPPPVDFRASEIGLEAFGWNVENTRLVATLAEAVTARPAIRRIKASVDTILPDDTGVTLKCDGLDELRATLVIGADGRKSRAREAAGITTREWRYDQVALTAIFSHRRDHGETSTEFHTRQGPCTLVPMPGRRSSLVWMMSPQEAERIRALDNVAFARAVEARTHSLLGAMVLDGPRGSVPMGGLSVARFAARRIALVGEAAHAFPPIGAQGLNLGFRDVMALDHVLADATDDIGSDALLAAYDRSRRADVGIRTTAVDALNRSLLADFLPSDALRGAGLLALGEIGPLRRLVMRRALSDTDAPQEPVT